MATTATKRRSSPARKAKGGAAKATKRSTKAAKTPAKAAKKASQALAPSPGRGLSKLARLAVLKTLKLAGRKALSTGTDMIRSAAERTAAVSRNVLEENLGRPLPIQVAIDVAVPLNVAWDEWMTFDSLIDGVHKTEDVERDGDHLVGRTAPPRSSEWEAEIIDEREHEAFAWRSVTGSDCAGLVTFHRLSDRLTRIELDLDVVPTSPSETLALTFHLAHRRAETELRRFKARVEFINPDVYETDTNHNGSGPDTASD
jgi:uncharacterized membrane protein